MIEIDVLFFIRSKLYIEFTKPMFNILKSHGINVKILSSTSAYTHVKDVFDKSDIIMLKDFKQGGYHTKIGMGAYCYPSCDKTNTDKFFKYAYGLGNDNYLFTTKSWFKHVDAYLACGRYDAYKNSFNTNCYVLGLPKLYKDDNDVIEAKAKLHSLGWDSSKPTIIFQHTVYKSDTYDKVSRSLLSDIESTGKVLQTVSDKYNIIHKNHHQSHYKFDGFIEVQSGLISTNALLSIADVIISDYGGSALESILSDAFCIFMNDPENEKYKDLCFDNKLHTLFPNCYYATDMLLLLDKFSSDAEYCKDIQRDLKAELKKFLYYNTSCTPQIYADFLLKQLNNESTDEYAYTKDMFKQDDEGFMKYFNYRGPAKKFISTDELLEF